MGINILQRIWNANLFADKLSDAKCQIHMNPKKKKKNPKEIDRLLNKERCIKKTGQIMLKFIKGLTGRYIK